MFGTKRNIIKKAALFVLILGVLLHGDTAFLKAEGGTGPFTIGLFAWSLSPYLVVGFVLLSAAWVLRAFLAAALIFLVDVWVHVSVFYFPQSSTSPLGLVWTPFWNLVLSIPLGLFVGWLIERQMSRKDDAEAG